MKQLLIILLFAIITAFVIYTDVEKSKRIDAIELNIKEINECLKILHYTDSLIIANNNKTISGMNNNMELIGHIIEDHTTMIGLLNNRLSYIK